MNTKFDETLKELSKNSDNFTFTYTVKELSQNETVYTIKASKVRQETLIERIIKWLSDRKHFKQLRDKQLNK